MAHCSSNIAGKAHLGGGGEGLHSEGQQSAQGQGEQVGWLQSSVACAAAGAANPAQVWTQTHLGGGGDGEGGGGLGLHTGYNRWEQTASGNWLHVMQGSHAAGPINCIAGFAGWAWGLKDSYLGGGGKGGGGLGLHRGGRAQWQAVMHGRM
jgi:hypothetical protein